MEREKGKDCQRKTLSNLWEEALPPPVKGMKRQKGGQHQEGREMHCVGIDAPRIAFKMETLAQADTPFYSSSKTVKTKTSLFSVFLSILVQTVTFICLHTALTVHSVFSLSCYFPRQKLFSHSGINLVISIATLSGGENKFAG